MRIRHRHPPLLRDWINHPHGGGILAESDIKLSRHSRLAAKLLVFKSNPALCRFWSKALKKDGLDHRTLGAVTALSSEVIQFDAGKSERRFLECDPRYFCVIGLVRGHLSMEVISHESVHAGFAYARRARRDFWGDVGDLDEEQVCYPAGRIAAAINRFIHRKGLYS